MLSFYHCHTFITLIIILTLPSPSFSSLIVYVLPGRSNVVHAVLLSVLRVLFIVEHVTGGWWRGAGACSKA
jgi:hypothetical protein